MSQPNIQAERDEAYKEFQTKWLKIFECMNPEHSGFNCIPKHKAQIEEDFELWLEEMQ